MSTIVNDQYYLSINGSRKEFTCLSALEDYARENKVEIAKELKEEYKKRTDAISRIESVWFYSLLANCALLYLASKYSNVITAFTGHFTANILGFVLFFAIIICSSLTGYFSVKYFYTLAKKFHLSIICNRVIKSPGSLEHYGAVIKWMRRNGYLVNKFTVPSINDAFSFSSNAHRTVNRQWSEYKFEIVTFYSFGTIIGTIITVFCYKFTSIVAVICQSIGLSLSISMLLAIIWDTIYGFYLTEKLENPSQRPSGLRNNGARLVMWASLALLVLWGLCSPLMPPMPPFRGNLDWITGFSNWFSF